MSSGSILVVGLDAATLAWLNAAAAGKGTTAGVVAARLLERAVAAARKAEPPTRHHDLDHLAGSWTEADAEEFRRAVEWLDRVEPFDDELRK